MSELEVSVTAYADVKPHSRSMLSSILLIATCCLAMIVSSANASVSLPPPPSTLTLTHPPAQMVSISVAIIGRNLSVAPDQLQWVVSAFALTSGCFLLLLGRVADIYGRKKVFLAGMAFTCVFTLVSGFAPNAVVLDVFRALTGIGPAAALPAAVSLALLRFYVREKGLMSCSLGFFRRRSRPPG